MANYIDMGEVDIGNPQSVLAAGYNTLSTLETAPETSPEVAVNTPSKIKHLAPQGDGLDGAREAQWNKLS